MFRQSHIPLFTVTLISLMMLSYGYCEWQNDMRITHSRAERPGVKPVDFTLMTSNNVVSALITARCNYPNSIKGKLLIYTTDEKYIDIDLSCFTNYTVSLSSYDFPDTVFKWSSIHMEYRISFIDGVVDLSLKEDYCCESLQPYQEIRPRQYMKPYLPTCFTFHSNKLSSQTSFMESMKPVIDHLSLYNNDKRLSLYLTNSFNSILNYGSKDPCFSQKDCMYKRIAFSSSKSVYQFNYQSDSYMKDSDYYIRLYSNEESNSFIPYRLTTKNNPIQIPMIDTLFTSIRLTNSPFQENILYFIDIRSHYYDGDVSIDTKYKGDCTIDYSLYKNNEKQPFITSVLNTTDFPQHTLFSADDEFFDLNNDYFVSFSIHSENHSNDENNNDKCKSVMLLFSLYQTNFNSYNLNKEVNTIYMHNKHKNRSRYLYGYLYVYNLTETKQYLQIEFVNGTNEHQVSVNVYTSTSEVFSKYLPNSPSFYILQNSNFTCSNCFIYFTVKLLPHEHISLITKYSYFPMYFSSAESLSLKLNNYLPTLTQYLPYISEKSQIITIQVDVNITQSIYIAVSTSYSPSQDHNDAILVISPEVSHELPYTLTISSKEEFYCMNCMYYFTVGLYQNFTSLEMDSSLSDVSINNQPIPVFESQTVTLSVLCNSKKCSVCSSGYDPSSFCNACLNNHYGSTCISCDKCLYGKCNDGIHGDGKCICDQSHTGNDCTTCKSNYFGINCDECPVCSKGLCDEGMSGTGICICPLHFSSETLCNDCIHGYYGINCTNICPTSYHQICSNNGYCEEGLSGRGVCICNKDYTDYDCSVSITNTTCNHFCISTNGYCDNNLGQCICYSGYYGKSCELNYLNYSFIYFLSLGLGVVIIIFSVFTFKYWIYTEQVKHVFSNKKRYT